MAQLQPRATGATSVGVGPTYQTRSERAVATRQAAWTGAVTWALTRAVLRVPGAPGEGAFNRGPVIILCFPIRRP